MPPTPPAPLGRLRIGLIMDAWGLYRKYLGFWLTASAICCGLQVGIWFLLLRYVKSPKHEDPLKLYLLMILLWVIVAGTSRFFQTGLTRLALDQLVGEPLRLRRMLAPSAGIWVSLVTSLVVALGIQLGYTMYTIPGLILEGMFLLVCPILADKKLSATDTLRLSIQTLQPELLQATLVGLVLSLLSGVAGAAMSSVVWPLALAGVIFFYPLVPQVQALLYRSYFTNNSFEYRVN
jgi:hypothetical protein